MRLYFLKVLYQSFGVKVFAIFTLFIFVISASFTCFSIHRQSRSLRVTLIKDGKLLAGILSYNSRIGVFAENEELLKVPVEGVFQQEGVSEVSVFNLEGELLARRERGETKAPGKSMKGDRVSMKGMFEKIRESNSPFFLEGQSKAEFWSPVTSGAAYSVEEPLFFEEGPLKTEDRIIGFVRVVVDKGILNKRLNDLLYKGILIGVIFLITGSGLTYLVVRGVTKPLNRLTVGVKALGMGGDVEEVPVETEDEIGKLAEAFNSMSESLKSRESEKEQLEEQLRHAQKMEAVGTLAGGIAHDFNNILTAIIGYASLLQAEMEKDDPLRGKVEQILDSAGKAANLTQGLLAFSRKQLIEPRPVNLNECIKNVEKLLSRLIREDIEIRVNLAGEDLVVLADSGQIQQALMNLVTNARDAMSDGGVLTIATGSVKVGREFFRAKGHERPGRYALLSVTDTGVGMDERTREKIFDPFYTTKEVGMGTGLGLSMVYGIIKQHEGYIDVSSKPGEGTTFRIYLRLAGAGVEEKEQKMLGPVKGGDEEVLIAEDNESVRRLSKEILEGYGYSVIEATDGEDAIRKFMENKERIQILLLDVMMPKKNGRDVYEKAIKVRPDIKALFMTGYASDIIHEQGIVKGRINMIYKPVSPEALLRKVREVLDE
jgi:signal transduction histidine kinase/CheY-like chemotaxis protein